MNRAAARRDSLTAGATAGVPADDELDMIELASAVLVRNFELLRRRSGVYADLDRAEYLLLRVLEQGGPADIAALAGGLGLDPSTAGRQVAVLQDKGLVRREAAAANRRRSIISPTREGRRRLAATRQRRRNETSRLLEGWTADDLRTLAVMFTRYNEAVARRYLALLRSAPGADGR